MTTANRTLSHTQARRVYDRIGPLQDSQAWYEDQAVGELIAHGDFAGAGSVVEIGCGTGRHAARLLGDHLAPDATYVGLDVSPRMVTLATARLAGFGHRARVVLTDGAMRIDAPAGSIDRVISTYVLDLLSVADIRALLAEAHRVLARDGRLCVVSAAPGRTLGERLVMGVVGRLHAVHPALIAGCRPLDLRPLLDRDRWRVEHADTVSVIGICSQIVVATPRHGTAP